MDMEISSHTSNDYSTTAVAVVDVQHRQNAELVKSDIATKRQGRPTEKFLDDTKKSSERHPVGMYLFNLGDERLSILQDEASHRFVYRQVDSDTDRVQKQFPYESELARVAFLREVSLDQRV